MATVFKLTLAFLFLFFVINSSKAGKTVTEEGIGYDNGFSGEQHYNVALNGEKDFYQ